MSGKTPKIKKCRKRLKKPKTLEPIESAESIILEKKPDKNHPAFSFEKKMKKVGLICRFLTPYWLKGKQRLKKQLFIGKRQKKF
jgi:hypothetical protein